MFVVTYTDGKTHASFIRFKKILSGETSMIQFTKLICISWLFPETTNVNNNHS
jgi:hypothetical protein